MDHGDRETVEARGREIFEARFLDLARTTDRMFAGLMAAQWILGIAFAVWVSPRAWAGMSSQIHLHVFAAVLLGGAVTAVPILLALIKPGATLTRHAIAVGQMMTSALLIHLTGGRIETHFHVFGSLAFLAFYRDWRVMMTATAVVALDHGARGVLWPQSVYGVSMVQAWRFLEHTGWVVFEDAFLCFSITKGIKEMRGLALQQAQLEEGARSIERKVVERTEELAETNRKLVESERLRSEFLANVSHELRTPLTLTLSPIESILAGDCGPVLDAQERLLRSVHNNSVRLLQMVSSLLDFSKLEAGKIEVRREPTPILALTRQIFSDFQPLMHQRGIRGELAELPEETVVDMDRYLYEKILFNLLSNAVKFTPKEGNVCLSMRLSEDSLRIGVCDTGIGISRADMPKLFQKFAQLEGSSTRRFEGTGLGLALVREFAGLLGGTVSVESAPALGSTFLVDIPARRVQAPSAPVRPSTAPLQRYASLPRQTEKAHDSASDALPRVLVAEDNSELALYISDLLGGFCQTRIARDGEEALELVKSWAPILVLSDVMMPRRDGLSLCRAIKADPATLSIPVVLLTALTYRDAMLQGWEAGADEYIYKPFHPKEMVTRIRAMVANIQERRRIEGALEAKARALARSNADLEQFAYAASHDLQEPLRKVTNFTELLKERYQGRLDADADRFIGYAVDGAHRMMTLIDSLLEYSRVGNAERRTEPTDLVAMLKRVVADLELRVKDSGARVTWDPLPTVSVDPLQMSLVLQNLIGNALKFRGEQAPVIHVSAERWEDGWLLRVRDNGIGIDPKHASQLFTMFRRLHSRRAYPGTGIGLAISKKIIERHGGRIWVESSPGAGATFCLTLPTQEKETTHATAHRHIIG
ncbi:MAG: response regulator [Elusimicrobia bacterium]|nr:response regulator [Elusimicrobiota bacterium]